MRKKEDRRRPKWDLQLTLETLTLWVLGATAAAVLIILVLSYLQCSEQGAIYVRTFFGYECLPR